MWWKLKKIAREEGRRGSRVRLGYGKIRIGEQWWTWDEKEEVLKDGRGSLRRQGSGEGSEGKEREIK